MLDGRGRADRLALDPAGAALASSATASTRAASRSSAAAAGRRVARLGLRARPRAAPAALAAALVAGGALLALALPALHAAHAAARASPTCRSRSRSCSTYERDPGGVPGRADAGERRRAGADDVTAPRCRPAIGELKRHGARERADARADRDRGQPDKTVATRLAPARRQRRQRRASIDALQTLRERRDPGDDRRASPASRRPSPARPPARTTSTSR